MVCALGPQSAIIVQDKRRLFEGVTVIGWLVVLIVWSFVSIVSLVFCLIETNPLAIGPLGVTIWFLVAFSGLASIIALVLYAAKTYMKLHSTRSSRLRYSWRQGMLVSGWIIGLLSLSSLNQLSVLDVILLGILLVIVEVYVRFRWP